MFRVLRYCSFSTLTLRPRLSRKTFAHAVDKIPILESTLREEESKPICHPLDSHALTVLRSESVDDRASLIQLLQQYDSVAGKVLDMTLAYEPSPRWNRWTDFDSDDTGVVLLTHIVDLGQEHKATICSGFAIHAHDDPGSSVIVSCAHTLEEVTSTASNLRPILRSNTRFGARR